MADEAGELLEAEEILDSNEPELSAVASDVSRDAALLTAGRQVFEGLSDAEFERASRLGSRLADLENLAV